MKNFYVGLISRTKSTTLTALLFTGLLFLGLQPAVQAQEYCSAGATSTSFEKIGVVTFNTIHNESPTNNSGYEDFTDISTDVGLGNTYSFSVSSEPFSSFEGDEVIVWIDFNQDFDFDDEGEHVLTTPSGLSPWSGEITIPVDAMVGETRMRIRLHDSGATPNFTPCGDSNYGQVEDYTVNIVDLGCFAPLVTYETERDCEDGGFYVEIDITDQDSADYFVSYTLDGGDSVAVGPFSYTDSLSNIEVGLFPFYSVVDVTISYIGNSECDRFITGITDDPGACPLISCGPDTYEYCYGNNEEAMFYYQAETGSDLYLRIDGGQMEGCCDYFEVYNGLSTDSTLLFSGNGLLPANEIFHSTNGQILVRITSDVSVSCQASGYTPITYTINCAEPGIGGCTDPLAINYNPEATEDNGDCDYPIVSCGADEYEYCYGNNEDTRFYYQAETGTDLYLQINAGVMEGCCDYFEVYDGYSTDDNLLFSGNSTLPVDEVLLSTTGEIMVRITSDGSVSCTSNSYEHINYSISCEAPPVEGCTDPTALNFNPIANIDDGSCILPPCEGEPQNVFTCYGNNAFDTYVFEADTPGVMPVVYFNYGWIEDGWDEITIYDGENTGAPILFGPYGGNLEGIMVTSTSGFLTIVIISDGVVSCAEGSIDYIDGISFDVYCGSADIPGCMDPEATNYDPSATEDDGSCIYPPEYDDCFTALEVPVNADMECGEVTPATIAGASASEQDNPCFGTADDDVWFAFTATSESHYIELLNVTGSTFDLEHVVYSGACDSLVDLSCNGANTSLINGLTIGETYLIRVYSWTSTAGQNTTFDVCVGTPPPPPANDDCTFAIEVPVNIDLNCDSLTSGTIMSATESPQENPCFGTADDDVWFSFTATDNVHTIDLMNVSGSTTDLYHAVYSGGCDSLFNISCSDANSSEVAGLTIGETYLIRVYTWTSTPGQTTTFDLCVGTYPPPPANDDCEFAVEVTVDGGVVMGDNTSAGPDYPSMDCAFLNDAVQRDVWFSFVAPLSGNLEIETSTGTLTDTQIQVLDACDGEVIACDEDSSEDGLYSLINIDCGVLEAGATYLIQVDGYSSAMGSFGIEVRTTDIEGCTDPESLTYNPCATVDDGSCLYPSTNDACAGAIALTCNEPVTGNTLAATLLDPPTNCTTALNTSSGVWYTIEGVEGTMTASLCNSEYDTKIGIFSGSCGELVCVVGNNDDAVGAGVCDGGTVSSAWWIGEEGETYYIYVTGNEEEAGVFELLVTCPPSSVNDTNGEAAAVSMFPNPNAGDEVRVQLDGLSAGNHEVNIVVYDVYGKLISSEGFDHTGTKFNKLVRFNSALATGVYMVQVVIDGEQLTTERLIVQ